MKYVALNVIDNDILLHGDTCITTLKELYMALVDEETTEIELRKDFIESNFTYMALCNFIESASAIAPNIAVYANDAYYSNSNDSIQQLREMREPFEYIYAIESAPSKFISTIHMLCESYLQAQDDANVANNKLANMHVQNDALQKELQLCRIDKTKVEDQLNETQAKLSALVSRVNFKYEKTLVPDDMFLLRENNFNHILYIKEISRVHYVDTMIHYLEEILKTLYNVPSRLVVIEPYYAYKRAEMYPGLKPHWSLTYQDVYSEDIFMAGFQSKLMKDILQDPNHIQYLIILDRAGYMTEHVQASNVTTIYTVSDLKDISDDVPKSHIISYSESTMYIPYIEDFDGKSLEMRVQMYSSMSVIKECIKFLEE